MMNTNKTGFLLQFSIMGMLFLGTAMHTFSQNEAFSWKNWSSRANLQYSQPVSTSEEGMPVGNGRMGSLVWTTPQAEHLQINRVDIFGNSTASNNFYERNTDYCGGAGLVDLDFSVTGEEVFTSKNFSQKLRCEDGTVEIGANGVKTTTFVGHEQDVMAIKVEDSRQFPEAITARLRTLRPSETHTGNHTATSKVRVEGDFIVLTQEFKEDSYYCASAVALAVSGRTSKSAVNNEREVELVVKPGQEEFTVFISSAASFNPSEDVASMAIKQAQAAMNKGYASMYQGNLDWWKNFWNKGYIQMHSSDGVADTIEQNYVYYLYVMASSSLGNYPPKFNGMLWTTEGDTRKWGNLFWGANQSCLYNGLFPTNRPELMQPMFKMYSGMKKSLENAATQQWGSKGLYIPETVGFDGLPELPDSIAREMRDLYLCHKPWSEKSTSFVEYASTQMPYLSRWNWKKDEGWKAGKWQFTDKGGQTYGHVTHIFSRGAKIAYQYWQQYEYNRDLKWLREEAYPMLKGVAEFYRNFPNVKKEKDGKYHIYCVNDNESIWGGHNTVEEISSMMGIFPAVIKASEILNVDAEMRPVWKEFIKNLSPLPLSTDYKDEADSKKPAVWVRSLPPMVQGRGNRVPDPNTMPVWFFDLCNVGCDNPEAFRIANATYDRYFPKGIDKSTTVNVLSKLPVAGTILGRTDATRYLIPNQINTAEIEVMPNRMDLREGFQTTSVQRLGRAADALHYALLQSAPSGPGKEPVIRLFQAWPSEWDADFCLLARGNFLISSKYEKGQIKFVRIISNSGSDCTISNPWPGKKVNLCKNGKVNVTIRGAILTFKTEMGDELVLNPAK